MATTPSTRNLPNDPLGELVIPDQRGLRVSTLSRPAVSIPPDGAISVLTSPPTAVNTELVNSGEYTTTEIDVRSVLDSV